MQENNFKTDGFFYQIPCLALDEIFSVTANRALVELTAEEQTRVDTSPGMTLLPSSLLEINCIVLLPQLLAGRAQQGRRGASISYAEIIEALLTAGFHFIGLRMLLLGVAEAADCAKLYSACLPSDWKPHHLVSAPRERGRGGGGTANFGGTGGGSGQPRAQTPGYFRPTIP